MKAFWAITFLTIRNALRSHIFQLLLGILLVAVVVIPTTINGNGTAQGYIQISLQYSLSSIAVLLSLSAVWLGCFSMTQDIEGYQLHQVVTKPVHRGVIWLAKWLGVALVHTVLLLAAAIAIYFTILWQFNLQNFPQAEKDRIKQEILVGRRTFMPDNADERKHDIKANVRALQSMNLEKKLSSVSAVQDTANKELIADSKLLIGNLQKLNAAQGIPYTASREWIYSGMPADYTGDIYIKYRVYIGETTNISNQRPTHGEWTYYLVRNEYTKSDNAGEADKLEGYEFVAAPQGFEEIPGGIMAERIMPAGSYISPDGTFKLSFQNRDNQLGNGKNVEHATLTFKYSDGPKVMIPVASFFSNYLRTVLVLVMQILVFTGMGCAAASFLSLPTAIFVVISYILFGSFASYMLQDVYLNTIGDNIGYWVSWVIMKIIIPMQNFDVTGHVANGELVEFSKIGNLFLEYFVMRGLPFFLLGFFCYWKRELGLVIRK